MIRLLVAGINWPPETFIYRLLTGLAEADVEVTVATPRPPDHPRLHWLPTPAWHGPVALRMGQLCWSIVQAGRGAPDDLKLFIQYSLSKRSLRGQMIHLWHLLPFAGGRWDIVYIPWNSAAIGFLPLFDLGMPVVVSCRGSQVSVAPLNPERAVHKAGLTTIFKRAAAVHCVSEAIVADALLYGLDPSKADVIRPAVDPDFFYPSEQQSADRGRFRLITTGTLIWRKGYEYMLAALRRLHDQEIDAHLTIIGDGPERQRVLYTIHDLGLEQQVVLLGRLAPERVREQLWQADAFVLSSVSEGISNAVLEAMACGLPVVVTNCGGMREAVTDGVEGFVVPVRDAAALATALSRLSASSALRRQMGHAARNRIIAQFTLDQQVKQFVDLFEMVVQKHPHEILRSCTPVS